MGAKVRIEVDQETLEQLVVDWLSKQISADISVGDVKIEVKSDQNYRSKWETADFRASVEKIIGV